MGIAKRFLITVFALFLIACDGSSDSSSNDAVDPVDDITPITDPEVSLPPDIGAPFTLGLFDLSTVGYEQQEFFLGGMASAFTNTSELGSDGEWLVEAGEQAAYTTRILVRRPSNSADFNGTVLVEWMNVSSGFDFTPVWDNGHVEMVREGYVWVGVSTQFVSVYGREGSLVPFNLKSVNPERYAELIHPGDSFSYDIFSQVARAIRNPQGLNVLEGLTLQQLIGAGQSQSAFRLTTYVNAIHPVYNPYDAYLIHSRANYSSTLSQSPQVEIQTPEDVFIRTDLNVPVMVFQSETDLLRSSLNTVRVRQPDTQNLRTWEVAGTSHSDLYSSGGGWSDIGDDPEIAAVVENNGVLNCDIPINFGPLHYVYNAALRALNVWVDTGEAPASSELLSINDDLSAFVLDMVGNVRGGIRTPYVDAPVAVLSGLGEQSEDSFCRLFGTTSLLSTSELVNLYGDKATYVNAVIESSNAAVEAGFLLQVDANQIIEWAPQQWDSQM
ncbi:MAG: alpha/beta hydrolase domain-containing protein [Halioglobus sp.]